MENSCEDFRYNFQDDVPLSVVFGICFIIGLPMVFTSYRFFRISLYLQVLSFISCLVYVALLEASVLSQHINILISVGSGVLIAFLATFFRPIGFLIVSLLQSVFLTSLILFAVNAFITTTQVIIAPSLVAFCFIVLSIPILKWERTACILYFTSFGALLMMLSIDYYLDLSMLRLTAYENLMVLPRTIKPCWFSWILLGAWPVLVFLGSLVQLLKTGRNTDITHNNPRLCCSRSQEPKVRLLSNKSDVIAKAWIHTSTLPPPYRARSNSEPSLTDDDVFLVENTTPV